MSDGISLLMHAFLEFNLLISSLMLLVVTFLNLNLPLDLDLEKNCYQAKFGTVGVTIVYSLRI